MREGFLLVIRELAEEDGYVFLRNFDWKNSGMLIIHIDVYFSCFSGGDLLRHNLHSSWTAQCRGVEELNVKNAVANYLHFKVDHPLVRWINKRARNLLFYNRPNNYLSLICGLYVVHQKITEGTVPFMRYFNCTSLNGLRELITGGHGVLASGPKELLQLYAEELEKHGCEARIHDFSGGVVGEGGEEDLYEQKYEMLQWGESYLVAQNVDFYRV